MDISLKNLLHGAGMSLSSSSLLVVRKPKVHIVFTTARHRTLS